MGLLKTAARTAVASSVHGRVQRRQRARWAQQDAHTQTIVSPQPEPVASHASAQAAPGTPGASRPPHAPDTAQQLELLKQLGELRKAGVLTEAEFETKKVEILGS